MVRREYSISIMTLSLVTSGSYTEASVMYTNWISVR